MIGNQRYAGNRSEELEDLEELKVLLRLCQDVKAFPNFNSFECVITPVGDTAKQNEGWLKSQRHGLGQNRRVMPDSSWWSENSYRFLYRYRDEIA